MEKNFITERDVARDESLSGRASARIKPNIRKSESHSRTHARTHERGLTANGIKLAGNHNSLTHSPWFARKVNGCFGPIYFYELVRR